MIIIIAIIIFVAIMAVVIKRASSSEFPPSQDKTFTYPLVGDPSPIVNTVEISTEDPDVKKTEPEK